MKEATAIVTATPKHIESVRKKIAEIKKSMSGHFFELGDLLKETRDGGYHMTWGFANFGEWLDTSGLDMSERAAYYLIKIVELGAALNIPREKLEQVKISKLREIASLDFVKDAKKIRKLVDSCIPDKDGNEMSLEDVRQNVAKVKAGDDKLDVFVFMTIKVTKSCKEEVIDPAIEMARAEYGDTLKADGEGGEITPCRAIEMILANYMAGDHGEREEEPLPVEGQKALNAAPEFSEFDEQCPTCQTGEHFPPKSPGDSVIDAEIIDPLVITAGNEIAENLKKTLDLAVAATTLDDASVLVDQLIANPVIVEKLEIYHSPVDEAVADCKRKIAEANERINNATPEDDPLLTDAVMMLQDNPETTANNLKLTFRIGEFRAFNLYKAAKGKL